MNHQNENEDLKRTGHIYDGIEELDNPPPNWFMVLFYVTIAFGVCYAAYYFVGEGQTLTEEYRRDNDAVAYAAYQHQVKSGPAKMISEDELKSFLKNPEMKAKGKTSFLTKCASCHGNDGQGGIGPNLTDAYWIHGGKLSDIAKTVTQGVPEKGMPPWGPLIPAEEIHSLTVFIRSLAGTKPAGAKAPQGDLFKAD
ncbi:MAG: c-type cytochrome [Bdellovibrionales bacterium]|nr:c-type cytochrome [Bdellovibrionales bacterium]